MVGNALDHFPVFKGCLPINSYLLILCMDDTRGDMICWWVRGEM